MSDGQTWRTRAAEHWAKAHRASDHQEAYIHLLIAADCYAYAVKAETGSEVEKAGGKIGEDGADPTC